MEMERRRAFEAVRALLRGLAERNPVLLLVDDLQYAGQSTVELMHFLGREQAGARLLVLATVRAENDAQIGAALAPGDRRVEVGPLGRGCGRGQPARAAGQGELADRILEQNRGDTRPLLRCSARWQAARKVCPSRCGPPCRLASGAQGPRWRPCSGRPRCSERRSIR